jgi:hypothetical protein
LPAAQPPRLFNFDHSFWVNLHHYLYVLGRVEAGMSDIKRRAVAGAPADEAAGLNTLDVEERQTWRQSVADYAAGLSRRDAVFDDEMVKATGTLVRAGSAQTLANLGLPPAAQAALELAAPMYRKTWWPRHQAANRERMADLEPFVAKYGPQVLAFITRAYQESWPSAGFPVNISAFSNWAGAYSTDGTLLVVSSMDKGTKGSQAFEIVFHEAMHQWDEEIFARLQAAAARQKVDQVPPDLSHAMIFYTAGEAVGRTVPGHVPYAQQNGMWRRGNIAAFHGVLERTWKPYLDGTGTLDAALDALITGK